MIGTLSRSNRKMQNSKSKIWRRGNGFALLIAIIVSAIILTIGLSIVNTAIKEVILASTVRNSTESLYAADTGVECALYWDNIRGNFTKLSAFTQSPPGPSVPPNEIECMGVTVSDIVKGPKVSFWLRDVNRLNEPCVLVTVYASPANNDMMNMLIDSYGYNTCNESNQRRVDRALQVKYSRPR